MTRLLLLLIVVAVLLAACGDTFGHTSREQIRADRDVAVAEQHRAASEAWAYSARDGISNVFRYAMYACIALFVFATVSHFFWSAGRVAETGIRAHENIRIAEIRAGVRHAQIAADDRARLMSFLRDVHVADLDGMTRDQFDSLAARPGVSVAERGFDEETGQPVGALVVNGHANAYRMLTG